jgi:hypothetical protein
MTRDWKGRSQPCTRTEKPVKYYWIDFGASIPLDPKNENHLAIPNGLGAKIGRPPEIQEIYDKIGKQSEVEVPVDLFAADIWYLGNLLRQLFTEVRECSST